MVIICTAIKMRNIINTDLNTCNVKQCFKTNNGFESRRDEVTAIRSKFPTKVPLFVERYYKEKGLPLLDKSKFLVPQEISMSQFLAIIKNRMKLGPNQAIYLLINNRSMISMSQTMAQVYQNYADEDGFLYITYASQEMFGYHQLKMYC